MKQIWEQALRLAATTRLTDDSIRLEVPAGERQAMETFLKANVPRPPFAFVGVTNRRP
jgi:hypothetical protein